ncbi:ornithine aminomutase subunit alpha [Methylomarinum sp. Ch1-1]|uniref:Ornithine aminomutase subunit alpha n=1 Tax=Methylomarinum roseum TaxID=3067653 RepID=A0AAU7NQF2_9GAMM|nr:ornithine aminomutase subunit alpha [Methylomarinum sp. Ch1-1]MDP4520874.1 ornithine aminomutase subunit alpha [Methylomarinum sp. Ch1-1]
MSTLDRPDDFETRRQHLRGLSDAQLHARFWELVQRISDPLVEEARTHTSPGIERSVLLRMGFTSAEAKQLVDRMHRQGLLGHGAGHLLLQLALRKGLSVRAAGEALLKGDCWRELKP